MPQILDLKEIDGELWACVGLPGDFPSGVALWTPEEQQANYVEGLRDAAEECRRHGENEALRLIQKMILA